MRNSSATPPFVVLVPLPPFMPLLKASPLLVCLTLLPVVALTTSSTARAEAEDSAAVEKVTKLNKKAVDEYQNLNFEEARKLLKSALDDLQRSRVSTTTRSPRAPTSTSGIVTFTGFKQRDEAIKQFRKALEIQADIKLDKILATPEMQEVYDEAVEQQKADAATAKKPPTEPKAPGRASITNRSRSRGRDPRSPSRPTSIPA